MKKNPFWLDSLGSPHWSITANCNTCRKYLSIITLKYLSARVYCIYLVTCCMWVFWNHRLICLIMCEDVTVVTSVRLYVYVCVGKLEMCVCGLSLLTVGAAIDFYAQANPSFLAPVQRDEPQEARHDSLLQLVANCALRVGVPREGLWTQTHMDTHIQWN